MNSNPDPTISMTFIAGILILMSVFSLFNHPTESSFKDDNYSVIKKSDK